MPPVIPPDAHFVVDPDISPRSLAPEQRRAKRSSYYATQGFGCFPDDIAEEGGPDRSVYLLGARWDGVTHMASQEDDMREGYFISARKTGPWRWILWRCSWADNESAWWWSSAGATSWTTKDQAAAAREMVRRLWMSWRDHPAPVETDATGLLYPDDIVALVAEAFAAPSESPDETGADGEATLLAPPGPAAAPDGTVEAPEPQSDAEMLASTSDADLARLLGIRYRNPEASEPSPPPSSETSASPDDPDDDEQGYGLGRRWRYPLRYRPEPEGPSKGEATGQAAPEGPPGDDKE